MSHAHHMHTTCTSHAHACHMHVTCTCTCMSHAHHMHTTCTCTSHAHACHMHVTCTCTPHANAQANTPYPVHMHVTCKRACMQTHTSGAPSIWCTNTCNCGRRLSGMASRSKPTRTLTQLVHCTGPTATVLAWSVPLTRHPPLVRMAGSTSSHHTSGDT